MLSLAKPVTGSFVIRQSRFVVHAAAVADQAATLAFYESVADPSATHNCWAWKLDPGQHRFNDDGEPAGTAGRPILAAIEGKGLYRVMVVVTRYFGGILLGVGGLVRAYGGSAARCLDQAELLEHHPTCRCRLEASFEFTGAVHAAIAATEASKLEESYVADGMNILLEVRLDRLRQLQSLLRDSTRGTANLQRI